MLLEERNGVLVLDVFSQALGAVQTLHDQQVVNGGMHPDSIVLAENKVVFTEWSYSCSTQAGTPGARCINKYYPDKSRPEGADELVRRDLRALLLIWADIVLVFREDKLSVKTQLKSRLVRDRYTKLSKERSVWVNWCNTA